MLLRVFAAFLALLVACGLSYAQEAPEQTIDPAVIDALEKMSDYVSKLESFQRSPSGAKA